MTALEFTVHELFGDEGVLVAETITLLPVCSNYEGPVLGLSTLPAGEGVFLFDPECITFLREDLAFVREDRP